MTWASHTLLLWPAFPRARPSRGLLAVAAVTAIVLPALTPASAAAITVTINTPGLGSMEVPMLANAHPRRQRTVIRRYTRLARLAEAVCRDAKRRGRARRMPAVTGSRARVRRFNRSRNRLTRLLRRYALPSAPRIGDFSQLSYLVIVRRLRKPGAGRLVSTSSKRVRLSCRFD